MAATGVLADFIPYVAPQVPLAVTPVLERSVLWACRRFLRRTLIYKVDLPAITLTLNSSGPYTPVLPQDADLVGYMSASQNGLPVHLTRRRDMDELRYNWQAVSGSQVRGVYPGSPGEVYVWPLPSDVTYPLNLRAALTLLETATTYPVVLYDSWLDTIVRGALAQTKLQMGQPWTDLEGGKLAMEQFEDELQDAEIEVARGAATVARFVKTPFFGA